MFSADHLQGLRKILLFGLFLMLLMEGCKPGRLNKDELIKYIQKTKNGLTKSQEINGIKVRISYQPKDLMIWQELENEKIADKKKAVDSLKKKYEDQEYFIVGLSKNNKEVIRQLGGFNQYSDMLQVLSFQMGGKVMMLTEKKDTIEMQDYMFQQTFGMSNENSLLFVFNSDELKKADDWILYMKEFGLGIGNLKFAFRRREIEKRPILEELGN